MTASGQRQYYLGWIKIKPIVFYFTSYVQQGEVGISWALSATIVPHRRENILLMIWQLIMLVIILLKL